jgi:TPP-dependent pyruvate/acetoin dehydrogenase alpha subunit
MLQQMMIIREVEQSLLDLFSKGQIKGTVHTCIGQEACAVGAMQAIDRDRDLVFSNHRGHGHVLAYGIPLPEFLGEILGRCTGPSRGLGGSQHMLWKNFMTSGIQGSLLPIATGAAFAEKVKKSGAISVVFLGDGTMGQGIVYESFNFAAKLKLPVLFLLENNGYAQTTKIDDVHAGDIATRAEKFGVACSSVDGNDVCAVLDHLSEVADRVRDANQPHFVELKTYRLAAHSKSDDTRPREEVDLHWQDEPILRLKQHLKPEAIEMLQNDVNAEVAEAVASALASQPLCLETYRV